MRSRAMSRLAGLTCGLAVVFASVAQAIVPPPQRDVEQFAREVRVVAAESGSKHPGRWDPDRVPYIAEIMRAVSPSHPSRITTVLGCAQSAKSEVGVNLCLHTISDAPRSILVLLPTHEEAVKWGEIKFTPNVKATPELRALVYRQRDGAKVKQKRIPFRGGFMQIASANNANSLQMITVGVILFEEMGQYEDEAGNRGDPVEQALARGTVYGEDLKVLIATTPGELGKCRGTQNFALGDQRRWAWECPHCDDWFISRFSHLVEDRRDDGSSRIALAPPCCGALIGQEHVRGMNAGGRWVPTFVSADPSNPAPGARPDRKDASDTRVEDVIRADHIDAACARDTEGRDCSFHIWQGMSPFGSWSLIWESYQKAKSDPTKLKAFYQQVLGEAYDEAVDTPDFDKLLDMAGGAPRAKSSPVRRGVVPNWAGLVTMAADLQGDRFEWAAYAWGPGPRGALIDHGIIDHPPMQPQGWRELTRTFSTEFGSNHLRPQISARSGVDTGGHDTQDAYRFVAGNPDVLGLKGKTGSNAARGPLIEQSRRGGKLRTAMGGTRRVPLTLLNTHVLKKAVYQGLQNALRAFDQGEIGPGLHLFLHEEVDLEVCRQLTAEALIKDAKRGTERWDRINGRANEQLDLVVYNYAMAISLGMLRWSADDWAGIFHREAIDPVAATLGPLEALMRQAVTEALPEQDLTVARQPGRTAHVPDWLRAMGGHGNRNQGGSA